MNVTATDFHIQEFSRQHAPRSFGKWVHNHPAAVKVIRVAVALFGMFAVAAAFWLHAPLAIACTITGIAALGAALTHYLFLRYGSGSHHDIRHHVYTPQEYPKSGQTIGKLFYRGHIPVLEIQTDKRFDAGEAHGFMLGPQIHQLVSRFHFLAHTVMRKPGTPELPSILEEMKRVIPEDFQQEMEGLAYGYNKWAEQAKIKHRLSLDDLILIHCLPEKHHFQMQAAEEFYRTPAPLPAAACTTILDEGVLARNMDWYPFGIAGELSLVVVYKPEKLALIGVPGMIGPVSFFTPHMVGAMNVCPGSTTSVRGMPAIFYNRLIAERTTHVEQVSQITGKPLGPYHLSLADTAGGARTISFYQGPGNTDHTRFFEDRPVITLNWTEPDHQGNVFNSQQRDRILKAYYRGTTKGMDRTRLATGALSLAPYVNSLISLHTIVAEPQKDRIWLAFDNGYSGSQEKQQFSISSFFA